MNLVFFQKYAALLIYPLLATFLSLIFTYFCIRLLPRLGYIDKPGGRHIHRKPIPRGGGVAVIASFFISLGCFSLDSRLAGNDFSLFFRLLWPSLVLAALGLVDDRIQLKSWTKLIVQIIVAGIIWHTTGQSYTIFGVQLPWVVSMGLTMIWVIGIINAFNLIDGLDGVASGLAIVSSFCMAIWFLLSGRHLMEAICMLILAGSCLGFLRYNFHPAKIFLGDTGSTFLGLIFAIIGLSSLDRTVTFTSLLLPLLSIGVPVFDVFLAVWRRSARKLLVPNAGGIMEGDQDHLHHRLLRETHKQSATALSMYLLGCAFAGVALFLLVMRNYAPAIAYIILLLAVLVVIRRLALVELVDSARLISNGLRMPRRGILITMIHPFLDFSVITFSFAVASIITMGSVFHLDLFLTLLTPMALLLCVSGVYRIYWLRAGIWSYWHLVLVLLLGSGCGIALAYFTQYPILVERYGSTLQSFLAGSLIFLLLNTGLIILERFLLHYAESFWFRMLYIQRLTPAQMERTLIYGGGLNCRLYLYNLFNVNGGHEIDRIIGIIDDDTALKGLLLYGFKVLGGVGDLDTISRRTPFDKVVVASAGINRENLLTLFNYCRERGIRVCYFSPIQQELDAEKIESGVLDTRLTGLFRSTETKTEPDLPD